MATSGSVDWTVTRDEIIKAAYRLVVSDEDFTPTTNQTNNAALLLNGIVKSYNASLGMPLWALNYAFILPVSGTYAATIGSGHVTASYTRTTLSADSAANDTTIDVTSASGISSTYYIGVELDDGDMHWTTVDGAPSGTIVTLTAGVASAASSGNNVYCYQTKLNRPLRIVQAYSIVGDVLSSTSDIPVTMVTTEEYLKLSNKSQEMYPLYLNYEPLLAGTVKFWPRFSNGERVVVIRYHRALEDFDATGDTPDFPQEWNLPLIYELAVALAPTYNVEVTKLSTLRKERDKWVSEVSENDYEEGSIYFQPGYSSTGT